MVRILIPARTPARPVARPTGYFRVAQDVTTDGEVTDQGTGYRVTIPGLDGQAVEVSVPAGACRVLPDVASDAALDWGMTIDDPGDIE